MERETGAWKLNENDGKGHEMKIDYIRSERVCGLCSLREPALVYLRAPLQMMPRWRCNPGAVEVDGSREAPRLQRNQQIEQYLFDVF